MLRRSRTISVVVLAIAVVLAACGSDSKTATTASSASSSGAPKVSGSVTVFAAASLTESFSDEQTKLKSEQPGLSITYNFAGSGALVTQIQQGAPADVIATADTASMKKLTDAGLVEEPATFAKNKLEILVAPGNPKRINTLADLARTDIKFVTEDETVPAGKYTAQALSTAGVTVSPVSKETDVKSAVAKVTSGEADATVVYVTDVTAVGSKGTGVAIPDSQNAVAEYPIAIVKATTHHDVAAAFIDAIVKGSGQTALHNRGFLPPT
ncbi:MAG: molybdate ABC transporter substrate-binding protein [Acidimicrobiales bacterium]